MTISGIGPVFGQIPPIKPREISPHDGVKPGGNFGQALDNALKEIDRLQGDANQKIEDATLGKEGVTSADAYLALEKADVAFQLMSTIRSKIIRAYEEESELKFRF